MIFIVTSAKVSGSTLAPCTESRNKVKIVVFGLVLYIYIFVIVAFAQRQLSAFYGVDKAFRCAPEESRSAHS